MTTSIKHLIQLLILAGLLGIALNASGQERRYLSYFDAVSISGNVSVTLVPGDSTFALITTSGMSEDEVSIFTKGKTLKIQLIEGLIHSDRHAEIVLTYTALRDIYAYAGARVETEGVLKGDKLTLRAASGGQLIAEVEAKSVEAAASEGGLLRITGQTEDQEASASTGGRYEGDQLECQRTYVKANTGGIATVVAREALDANSNTGGEIEYTGQPREKNVRSRIYGGIRRAQ